MSPKQPAYGGEGEVLRLREVLAQSRADGAEMVIVTPADMALIEGARQLQAEIDMLRRTPAQAECEHPATYVARVCTSCATVIEVEVEG